MSIKTKDITAVCFSEWDDKVTAHVSRFDNEGNTFIFKLTDNSIQALIDTLEKIWPLWHDAEQDLSRVSA